MIEIIPAIDIIDGKCTRLSQGDYATQKDYGGDPAEWARAYADCGVKRLHLVDLEGAKTSRPKNLRTLERIASLGLLTLEWGGGIKDDEALASVWNAGADEAIIGSIAAKEPERMLSWLRHYGSRIILGADVRDGMVAVSGWLEDSGLSALDFYRVMDVGQRSAQSRAPCRSPCQARWTGRCCDHCAMNRRIMKRPAPGPEIA